MDRTALALACMSLATACGTSPPAPTPASPSSASEARSEPAPSLPELMRHHFDEATEIRDALVRGDLAAARARASAIAAAPAPANVPPSWAPFSQRMGAAARAVAEAPDLAQAGLRFGALANVCADCHRSLEAHPRLDTSPPPSGSTSREHMWRHQWAMDRMWEGLMAPPDERFLAGASAFAEAPLEPSSVVPNQTVSDALRPIANRAHALGRNASHAMTAAARANVYGELLSTCYACHSEIPSAPSSR